MSWLNLNQSLNSIKGQITNFASEVLSEGIGQESGDENLGAGSSLPDLETKCRNQELEIAALKKLNDELQAKVHSEKLSRQNGVKEDDNTWYWDPPPESSKQQQDEDQYKQQIRGLQDEISTLKERGAFDIRNNAEDELNRLREENKNLTNNLEDLDTQHQLAMDRLLTLKRDLQKNFEVLKQEHESLKQSNDEYASEIKTALEKLGERDKEIEELKNAKADYDTLHHKYQNLERIYGLLRENAEKFQEDNQELHEEVFNLQEQVTKMEHDIEISSKHSELSDVVPRERYDDILKELNDIKHRRNSSRVHSDEVNIDDNAKSVIENLKREIHDLKLKSNLKEEVHDISEKGIPAEKIMQLYIKYVNFDIPVDLVGEIPTSGDNMVLFKLESVFKTVNSFKKEIDAFEHTLAEKSSNIRRLQTQVDDLTSENDYLATDLQHFESELKEMKKNNDFLINEIAALKNTSKLQPIIETHEDNLMKLESELADSNNLNKTFEAEIQRIETELNEVRREKSFLAESLEEMRSKFKLMLSDLEECKKQTIAIEEMESTANSNNADKIKKTTEEIEDLKKKLNAANAKNEQLAIDVHIIENDKVLLTKVVDDLKHELEIKTTAHTDLEALKTTLASQLKDIENKIDDIMQKKTDLKKDDLKLNDKIKWLAEEVSTNISKKSEEENELCAKLSKENSALKLQLKHSLFENSTQLEAIKKLNNELSSLSVRQQQNDTNTESEEIALLQQTIQELKEKVFHVEAIRDELKTLKEEFKIVMKRKLQVEADLVNTDSKILLFQEEFDKLVSDLNEKDNIIDNLNSTVSQNQLKINDLNQNITDLSNSVTIKNQEIERLTQSITEITDKYNQTVGLSEKSQSELLELHQEKEELNKHLISLNDEMNNKNLQISTLTNRLDEVEKKYTEYKNTLSEKDKSIKELNQSIFEITDKMKSSVNTHQSDECAKLVQQMETIENEVVELKHSLSVKDKELLDLKTKSDQTEKTCEEYKLVFDKSNAEKNELINLVNLKHNESIQYHNEIQRLNQILLDQTNEFKKQIDKNNSDNCTNCDSLRVTLKEKDDIIMTLNTKVIDYEKERGDLQNSSDLLNSLKERCENLDKSYATQLEIVKRLTAENVQLSEKEQNSTKELERLRQHLVETEDSYTQELMATELKLNECQTRLQHVEQRAKQTSTVYTSNSIRANQEVETLRNQIKLLEKQREEVQSRLSEAEDARGRSEAALTNLQIVLEQFQLEKERDIDTATEKIRNRTEELKKDNQKLKDDISRLNNKLEESIAGLQAANRLGDQVETKMAQINDLKEQVHTLQTTVAAAEERYHNAISNQQDKVDKNLVKNLVINYVLTASQNNSKTQVLKILSTVLDFNQKECERLGLIKSTTPQDSLAAEFVKFLQNESMPRARVAAVSRGSTPRSSVAPSPVEPSSSHKRNTSTGSNNLLFQPLEPLESTHNINMEMNTGVNQTRNNEGAILKHVLNDM